MARIELAEVVVEKSGYRVLDRVSFVAEDGEFVAVIGGSGAGKTSVLRAIAGFDPLTSGSVMFDGEDMEGVETRDRDIGLITQHDTLFPNYKVRRNISFPLLARAFGRREVHKRVVAESRALDIEHILDRWPKTLSGGEQRLAHIARALVRRPRVFLMDEPLAGLDPPTKRHLRSELMTLQRGYGVTTLYVANRPAEIMEMPDRVVALEAGRVVQIGTPTEVRSDPATPTIAELTRPTGF